MSSRTPQSEILALNWTQLPGSAQDVAASPDGSIWVVSNVSSGNTLGNSIWHYAGGTWTNIPGLATRLAAAPDGTVWAINGAGSIYHYYHGNWDAISGGAGDLSVGADGSLYVISNHAGNAYGNAIYHYSNGTWTQLPGAAVRIAASWDTGHYPGIGPGGFYVVNAAGSIFYDDPTSGYVQLPHTALQVAPTTNGGFFALGTQAAVGSGNPIYYDDLSPSSWTVQPGSAVSIATAGPTVFAVNAYGAIWESNAYPKTIFEYAIPTLASGPTSIVAAPDNKLWFMEAYTGRIGTATTAGVITDAALPGTNYATDLAVGADGKMWVTLHPINFGPSLIDQVTIASPPVTLTQNQIQNTYGIPGCITAGSDGNLWFVDSIYNTIGKIVPSTLKATEYGLPGSYPATYPNCITTGPNGNLWFTLPTTNQIGTMTTAGAVVGEYSITTAYSSPYDITSGPDGNLWFTEQSANKIGVMNTSGTMIAEYAVPTADSELGDITSGPDGNLWFTESAGNKIGRITPTGTITEFFVPTAGAGLAGITTGPDGNLWFTEANANNIGKIVP